MPNAIHSNIHKEALKQAFAVDKFTAYDEFTQRKLNDGEAVDVYLADLRRLAKLFGDISESVLACAFVSGLPDHVRRLLRAGARLDAMTLKEILTRTRAVLSDESATVAAGLAPLPMEISNPRSVEGDTRAHTSDRKCFECNQPGHFARDCLVRRSQRVNDRARGNIRCFRCSQMGHIASSCQGNGNRGRALAQAAPLDN